jgi:nicotinamidase-related amidase
LAQIDRPVPMEESALLVIDVQDSFTVGPRWERRSTPKFEENVTRLVDAFRAAGRPVIYFLHNDSDEHFSTTSPYYRLMNFLQPRDGEPLLHKTTRNCFTSTNLLPLLLSLNVRRIVIGGIQTEQCCETTARVGADLGFDVDFVTEATMTFPIQKTLDAGSDELHVEAIIERTEYVLRRRFARIATVDEIVRQLGALVPA